MAESTTAAETPVSSTLHEALASAFATEIRERLPRLAELAARMTATADASYAVELADECHALAAGAGIVGEDKAARLAQGCERLLAGCRADPRAPVPPAVAAAVAGRVAALAVLLLVRAGEAE